jgi:hypothetical protein
MNELAGLHGIPDNRAAYTGPLQGDCLRDCHSGCPCENSCRNRDRIAVMRGVIVNSLNTRRRAVGMINRRPAVQREKAAQKQRTQNGCKSSHNCGLSILAMRRLRPWYQNQLPWQVIFYFLLFFLGAVYLASTHR